MSVRYPSRGAAEVADPAVVRGAGGATGVGVERLVAGTVLVVAGPVDPATSGTVLVDRAATEGSGTASGHRTAVAPMPTATTATTDPVQIATRALLP
jgi:hypothetical protein